MLSFCSFSRKQLPDKRVHFRYCVPFLFFLGLCSPAFNFAQNDLFRCLYLESASVEVIDEASNNRITINNLRFNIKPFFTNSSREKNKPWIHSNTFRYLF